MSGPWQAGVGNVGLSEAEAGVGNVGPMAGWGRERRVHLRLG